MKRRHGAHRYAMSFIHHHSKVTKGHFSCLLWGPRGTSSLLDHTWTCRVGQCLKIHTPSCHDLCTPRTWYTRLFVRKDLGCNRHTFHNLERASYSRLTISQRRFAYTVSLNTSMMLSTTRLMWSSGSTGHGTFIPTHTHCCTSVRFSSNTCTSDG